MSKNSIIVITAETNPEFSLNELSEAGAVSREFIQELIEYGAFDPHLNSVGEPTFDVEHLRRIRMIVHLRQDLEVNTPGAVLVMELMQEMQQMRKQIESFEKYFRV